MIDQKICIEEKVNFPTVYSIGSTVNEAFGTGSTVDADSNLGQKVLNVAATTNFTVGDHIIINRGGDREEEGKIASIQVDVSITLEDNLVYTHTGVQADVVEIVTRAFAGQKVISVATTTNFSVGDRVVLDKGNAGAEEGKIASISAGVSITLEADLANTHAVGVAVDRCMASLSSVLYKAHYKIMSIFLPANWTTASITFAGCNKKDGTFNQVVKATDVAEVAVASVEASKVIGLDGIVKQSLEGIPYIKLRSGTLAAPVDQGFTEKEIKIVLSR